MRFDRYFTRLATDPYEGAPMRSHISDTGLEMTVPAAWDEAAAQLAAEKILGQALFPVMRVPVPENGVPLWLCPKAAESRNGPEIFETDIRQAIDRLGGFWTYRAWKAGHFSGDEESARVFYDEIRHVLLYQLASPALADWAQAGFSWAYGVGAPDPAALRPVRPECFDITAPDALSRIGRKTRRIFDALSRRAGRRLLLEHLDSVMAAYGTQEFSVRAERARQAGVPEGALGDALLYARQGYAAFPLFDEDDAAEAEQEPAAQVRVPDGFMGAVTAGQSYRAYRARRMDQGPPVAEEGADVIDAPALFQNMAGAIWSSGGLSLRFSSDRDAFVPDDGVYIPSCLISLPAFLPARAGSPFALEAFARTCRLLTVALDGLAPAASARPVALGFSGLDMFLQRSGLAYDGAAGRTMAAGLAALMSAAAWKASADMAFVSGVFQDFGHERETFLSLLRRQRGHAKGIGGDAVKKIQVLNAALCLDAALMGAAETLWDAAVLQAEKSGLRNSCVTALAQEDADVATLLGTLSPDVLRPEAEIRMRAAVQPFIWGVYGGVVSLPRDCAVTEVAALARLGWELGLMQLSLYREGSSMQYPLSLLEMDDRVRAAPAVKELVVLSEPPLEAGKKSVKRKKVSDG